jgi:hypothetical protein
MATRMCIGSHFATQSTPNIRFTALMLICLLVLKVLVATIYTEYKTTVIDDEGIEQADSYLSFPVGERLILGFDRIVKP